MVAAGTPVVSVACQGAKEVVVGVHENPIDKLCVGGAADPASAVRLRRVARCDCAVWHDHPHFGDSDRSD